jgi:multidrug efflux pump subunit AcrA (membrane-fusion protein)
MINSSLIAIAVIMAFAQPQGAERYASPAGDPKITSRIRMADQVKLPAAEAGVLVELKVKDGSPVKANEKIGQIDDREVQMQKKAAAAAYQAAYEKWADDVEIRYSVLAAKAAKADYINLQETNRIAERSVPRTELIFKELEWQKAELGKEKSEHDRKIAGLEARAKEVELEAANLAIQRRAITAPFDGVVIELKRKKDEWCAPGDTILHMLRLDTVYVDGAVDQSKYNPHEIDRCEVTVEVKLARQQMATVKGRITMVKPVVRSDGVYNVRAEVNNIQDQNGWVLREGMPAEMTIHLGTGGPAEGVSVSRAP